MKIEVNMDLQLDDSTMTQSAEKLDKSKNSDLLSVAVFYHVQVCHV